MNWLTWIFLESLPALASLLGTALFILLVIWRQTGRPRPLLVGLGVALVLLVVQAAVVTQREHAGRIMHEVEIDLSEGRVDALAATLAPDFTAGNRDRETFIAYVHSWIERVDIRWLDRQNLHVIESSPDQFAISVGYLATVTGDYAGTVPSRWRINFIDTRYGWMIHRIRCLRLAHLDKPDWQTIDHQ